MRILSYMYSNMYVGVRGHFAVLYEQKVYTPFLNHFSCTFDLHSMTPGESLLVVPLLLLKFLCL